MSLSLGIGLGLTIQQPVASEGEPFSPASLFLSNEEGVWYDPSDLSTLWQDSGRTTSVTADGDPVGAIDDKSGNGHHATQATAAKRPTYKTSGGLHWLEFDGVDDSLATGNIDFSSGPSLTDQMSVFTGLHKDSDTLIGMVVELSENLNNNNGTFLVAAPHDDATANYRYVPKGTVAAGAYATGIAAPSTNVLTGYSDISEDNSVIRIDGVEISVVSSSQGFANFGDYPLYIGARAGTLFPFNGKIYSMIVRGKQPNAEELAQTESYVAAKTGVSI